MSIGLFAFAHGVALETGGEGSPGAGSASLSLMGEEKDSGGGLRIPRSTIAPYGRGDVSNLTTLSSDSAPCPSWARRGASRSRLVPFLRKEGILVITLLLRQCLLSCARGASGLPW